MSPLLLTTMMGSMAAVFGLAGAYSIVSDLVLRDRSRVSRRIDDEFRSQQRDAVRKSPLFKNLAQLASEAGAEDEKASIKRRLEMLVEQSGLVMTVQQLLGMMAIASVSLGGLGFLVRQSLVVAGVGAAIGPLLPLSFVQMKRKARLEKLRAQLPDAFDLMARVIRAGQTMTQSLQAVADEFPLPIAGEFAYCYEQQNLGLPPDKTLRDLARRNGLIEIKIFVLALLVQQQTGGNLAELLEKLAHTVRERFRIRGQIRTLTAEGRLQGAILLVLPVFMFFILLVLNPNYALVLLQYPKLIVLTLIFEGFGALWIRKIVNFDF